ncbi:hypothetical protein D3C73_1087340 [compost metagenome]
MFSVSSAIALSYSSCVIAPFFKSALHLRTSLVCGNEPIVVVGNAGKLNFACCAALRSANTDVRLASSSVILLVRVLTSGLWINGEVRRLSAAALFASKRFAVSASTSPSAKIARSFTSANFCFANANQFFTSAGNDCSLCSLSKSKGTCNKDEEGATQIRSFPNASTACLILTNDFS